jgi:hypothetical protein
VRFRHCVAVVLLTALIAACSISVSVGGPGENYYRPDPGQIIFGTDLDSTYQLVKDKLTSIKQEGKVAFDATWSAVVTGRLSMTVFRDGGPVAGMGGVDCNNGCTWFSGKYNLSDFPGTGHYAFTLLSPSGEQLATGALDITP